MTIKEMREAAGMTQAAFAQYVGCTKSCIEKWEYGKPDCPEYVRQLIEYKMIYENKIKKERSE